MPALRALQGGRHARDLGLRMKLAPPAREREEKLFAPAGPGPCRKGAERGQERGWDREERKDFELRAMLNLESCKCLKWSPGFPSGGAMGTMREPAGPA